MAVQIQGGSSTAGKANVSSTYQLEVRTPQTENEAGFVQISSEVDHGSVIGSRTVIPPEASDDFRLRVGVDCPVFSHSFEGTIVAQDRIQQNLTTMTAAQASGYLTLNSGSAVASGNAANVRTYRTFPIFGTYPTFVNMVAKEAGDTASNAISEWGIGYVTGTSAPTDGAFFRRLSGGQLRAVLNFGGSEAVAADITTTNVPSGSGAGSYSPTGRNHYLISVHHNLVRFWINDTLVATLDANSAWSGPVQAFEQPVFARVYNSGIASSGRQLQIGLVTVEQGDASWGKPWPDIAAGMGGGGRIDRSLSCDGRRGRGGWAQKGRSWEPGLCRVGGDRHAGGGLPGGLLGPAGGSGGHVCPHHHEVHLGHGHRFAGVPRHGHGQRVL